MSRPKEPNYFSDDQQYARGMAWYEALFEAAQPDDLCGESSTHYTKLPTYPKTIERMTQALTDVKIMYVIRHPIDRLISHYIHAWTENWLRDPLETAVDTYPDLVNYSRYAYQIEPYVEAYGAERVGIVFFERLVSNPQSVLDAVAAFIGYEGNVTWHTDLERQNVSSERLRKSPWRDAVVNAPVLSHIRKGLVPRSVREWVKGFWRMQSRPELSVERMRCLEQRFNADLAELGTLIGRNVRCDNFKQIAQECEPIRVPERVMSRA